MPIHRDLTGTEVHVPHAWEYTDATAREAATGFTEDDLYRLALQVDDHSLWILTDHDPVAWVSVRGSASSVDNAARANIALLGFRVAGQGGRDRSGGMAGPEQIGRAHV